MKFIDFFSKNKIRKEIIETYYERLLRLKPIIESSEEIMNNISSVFSHTYLNENLKEKIKFLGQGNQHILYNVGKIEDQINKRDVHLATRLSHISPYNLNDEQSWMLINENLTLFEECFKNGNNPPYFCGIVNWKNNGSKIAGMILEDISENKKYALCEEDVENFKRKEDNKIFYLDPLVLGTSCVSHYSNKEAVINVQKYYK